MDIGNRFKSGIETTLRRKKPSAELEKRLAKLRSRQTIIKIISKVHFVRGPETKWEMSDKLWANIYFNEKIHA